MAAVYSSRLFRAPAVSGGPTTEFIAPETFRTVVKCISLVWGDVTGSGLDAWVQTQDLTKLVRDTWASTFSEVQNFGGCSVYWGEWVLDPLDELQVQTAAGTCDIWASGYLLSLP
ncbi:MAG: hypothetical protein WAL64_05495 [Candidatus Dormiibacterota bacterium]